MTIKILELKSAKDINKESMDNNNELSSNSLKLLELLKHLSNLVKSYIVGKFTIVNECSSKFFKRLGAHTSSKHNLTFSRNYEK